VKHDLNNWERQTDDCSNNGMAHVLRNYWRNPNHSWWNGQI